MRQLIYPLAIIVTLSITACGGKGSAETPKSIAEKWCDLNGKVFRAEGDAKEKAKSEREAYENKIREKYKNDEKFLEDIGKESEKCEEASEGR
jgi:predicted small lipoprotein YifL